MERINLKKYGFVRTPEEDFSDDGNRFTCYKVGQVRVSKLVADGELYLSGRIDANLDYSTYSKLPHYNDLDKLNGVSKVCVTEEDLQNFYNACLAYDKEYAEAEASIEYPSYEEIVAKETATINMREAELEEINTLVQKNCMDILIKMSKWEISTLSDNLKKLIANTTVDVSAKAEQLLDTYASIRFMNSTLAESYESRQIKNLIGEMLFKK